MRRFANLAIVLLLLVMASPIAACAANLAMTPSEKACCRTMQGHCDQMTAHPCCRIHLVTQLREQPASPSASAQLPVPATAIITVAFPELPAPAMQLSSSAAYHPSPPLRHLSTIVLRI